MRQVRVIRDVEYWPSCDLVLNDRIDRDLGFVAELKDALGSPREHEAFWEQLAKESFERSFPDDSWEEFRNN